MPAGFSVAGVPDDFPKKSSGVASMPASKIGNLRFGKLLKEC
jgi:hypothetical protein